MKQLTNLILVLACLLVPAEASEPQLKAQPEANHSEHHQPVHSKASGSVENLSPDLRNLLRKEMNALQNAMQTIMPHFIAGDWSSIAGLATQMRDSFILKQSLTEHQMHELHQTLSADFIARDKEFHYFAGMLAHAAEKEKVELVQFYYSKLTESCVGCHSQHATHRFPKLLSQPEAEHQH